MGNTISKSYYRWYPKMATTLTRKGQVTIPKPIRDRLGLQAGSRVEFQVGRDGQVRVLPAGRRTSSQPTDSRFAALRGRATVRMTTDEIMALTRGDD